MSKQEQIAVFLNEYVKWPRMPVPRFGEIPLPWEQSPYFVPEFRHDRPTAEVIANELLNVAEFRALQLATLSATTEGEVLMQAVEMVSPPFYRQDIELLVVALQHAAALQQKEGRKAAGQFALGALIVAVLVGIAIATSKPNLDTAA